MSRLTRDGTAKPVSRDQVLRHARVQGNIHFPCSAHHEQDWQPYPVDPYSAIFDDHTYIHTYNTLPPKQDKRKRFGGPFGDALLQKNNLFRALSLYSYEENMK